MSHFMEKLYNEGFWMMVVRECQPKKEGIKWLKQLHNEFHKFYCHLNYLMKLGKWMGDAACMERWEIQAILFENVEESLHNIERGIVLRYSEVLQIGFSSRRGNTLMKLDSLKANRLTSWKFSRISLLFVVLS